MTAFNAAMVRGLLSYMLSLRKYQTKKFGSSGLMNVVPIPLQLYDWWDIPQNFTYPCNGNINRLRRSTIPLELQFFLMVTKFLELFPELFKHWNIILFYQCHWVTAIIFKEKWPISSFVLDVLFFFAHFIYCLPCYLWLPIFYLVSYFIDLTLNVFFLFFLVCVSSLCVSLTFGALAFVWFLLLHKDSIFTLYRFSLTTRDSHGTLNLTLGLVRMNSAAASMWALKKF